MQGWGWVGLGRVGGWLVGASCNVGSAAGALPLALVSPFHRSCRPRVLLPLLLRPPQYLMYVTFEVMEPLWAAFEAKVKTASSLDEVGAGACCRGPSGQAGARSPVCHMSRCLQAVRARGLRLASSPTSPEPGARAAHSMVTCHPGLPPLPGADCGAAQGLPAAPHEGLPAEPQGGGAARPAQPQGAGEAPRV